MTLENSPCWWSPQWIPVWLTPNGKTEAWSWDWQLGNLSNSCQQQAMHLQLLESSIWNVLGSNQGSETIQVSADFVVKANKNQGNLGPQAHCNSNQSIEEISCWHCWMSCNTIRATKTRKRPYMTCNPILSDYLKWHFRWFTDFHWSSIVFKLHFGVFGFWSRSALTNLSTVR